MYYLTRIELDPYKKLTQLALKNANMIHGTIETVSYTHLTLPTNSLV